MNLLKKSLEMVLETWLFMNFMQKRTQVSSLKNLIVFWKIDA